MISLTPQVQLSELVWSIVAVLGAYFAWRNLREARLDHKALTQAKVNSARKMWASFSVSLHRTLLGIEGVFASVGIIAMLRRPGPDTDAVGSIVLAILLIGASGFLSLLSFRWTQVNTAIRRALAVTTEKDALG